MSSRRIGFGIVPVLVPFVVLIWYVNVIDAQGDPPLTSPIVVGVSAGLLFASVLALLALTAQARPLARRLSVASCVLLCALGAVGIFSIGLPLLAAGACGLLAQGSGSESG